MLRRGGRRGPRAWPRFELSKPKRWRRLAAPVIRVLNKPSSRCGAKPSCRPDPGRSWSETTTSRPRAQPRYLYQNNLVALDASKGINNGEPFLHARWIGAVAPKPGETVTHIGAGTGYYSAVLSMLVLPKGVLTAYEVDEKLAAQARRNLARFENVSVVLGNAVSVPIPKSDVIYVNAGVVAPPGHWLDALRPGARMIFPWRPTSQTALASLVTHTESGFEFKPLMLAWFIPCLGASETSATDILPDTTGAWQTRSLHLKRDRAPDESATAIYEDVWFSLESLTT